jgi:hypothetical protein
MTETGNLGADQHFARAGIRHADVLDHERLIDFMQDGGLHRDFLSMLLSLNTVIASKAKQSRNWKKVWIASALPLLAMTN